MEIFNEANSGPDFFAEFTSGSQPSPGNPAPIILIDIVHRFLMTKEN